MKRSLFVIILMCLAVSAVTAQERAKVAPKHVVDKSSRRRGTLPKYAVTQTVDDLAKGRDTVLEFTRELIRSGKGRHDQTGRSVR